jgi:nucleoside-diphosphate-sugar epimerase
MLRAYCHIIFKADFCYEGNVVQMNHLVSTAENPEEVNHICNTAMKARSRLNELFTLLLCHHPQYGHLKDYVPFCRDFYVGNVLLPYKVDTGMPQRLIGYRSPHIIDQGLDAAKACYRKNGV